MGMGMGFAWRGVCTAGCVAVATGASAAGSKAGSTGGSTGGLRPVLQPVYGLKKQKALTKRSMPFILVPRAGIEPAHLAILDFESSASTSSATEAQLAAEARYPTCDNER